MEKTEVENFCWYCRGHELWRCKYRILVTKGWDGDAGVGRVGSVLKKEENSLFCACWDPQVCGVSWAGLAKPGWGHWVTPVFRCMFCVPDPWNGGWILQRESHAPHGEEEEEIIPIASKSHASDTHCRALEGETGNEWMVCVVLEKII